MSHLPLSRAFAPLAALLAFLLASACVAGGTARTPSRSSTVIGIEEIRASTAQNAWDLIHQVRPGWLRGRGPSSIRDPQPVLPVVYLAELRHGPLELLRSFATSTILEIHYIDAVTATTLFGSGHSGGVIQVFLSR